MALAAVALALAGARSAALRFAGVALAAVALALAAVALALAGCGGSGSSGAPPGALKKLPAVSRGARQMRVEREHLAIVAHGLVGAEASIQREVRAARAAWPAIAQGLPARVSAGTRGSIAAALARTEAIDTPGFVAYAGELTGGAAAIAGLLLSFEQLAQRGWEMTLAAADRLGGGGSSLKSAQGAGGGAARGGASPSGTAQGAGAGGALSPAALRFVRANASLYIGGVYDGHYNLSVIGQRVREAYMQLGGAAAFGAALRPGLVAQLAGFYSPGVTRLAPKPPAAVEG